MKGSIGLSAAGLSAALLLFPTGAALAAPLPEAVLVRYAQCGTAGAGSVEPPAVTPGTSVCATSGASATAMVVGAPIAAAVATGEAEGPGGHGLAWATLEYRLQVTAPNNPGISHGTPIPLRMDWRMGSVLMLAHDPDGNYSTMGYASSQALLELISSLGTDSISFGAALYGSSPSGESYMTHNFRVGDLYHEARDSYGGLGLVFEAHEVFLAESALDAFPFVVPLGEVVTVEMLVQIYVENGASASMYLDPYFFVDPSLNADDYIITLSPGIANATSPREQQEVPAPSAALSLSAALAALAIASPRRRRVAATASRRAS